MCTNRLQNSFDRDIIRHYRNTEVSNEEEGQKFKELTDERKKKHTDNSYNSK